MLNSVKKECIAGVDIGGTSIKVLICDTQAHRIVLEKSPTLPAYIGTDGKTTDTGPQRRFDANKLWTITAETIRHAVSALPKDCVLRGISVSCCGCTVILLDEQDQQIDLHMEAGAREQEILHYAGLYRDEEFSARTGYPLDKENSGFHLSAYCRQTIHNQIAHVVNVDDYIAYRLCGELSRNYSTAVSCGMWDWKTNRWLPEFLSRTGLTAQIMGIPTDSGIPIGKVSAKASKETGLPQDILVSTGGHDYECAAFACHSFVEGNLFNITGTIDMLASFDEEKLPANIQGCRHISDLHVIPGQRSCMMETPGAVQTEWLKNHIAANDTLGLTLSWEDFFQQIAPLYADKLPRTELFIPKVFGTYIPRVDQHSFGMYCGLNKHTTAAALLLATIEGMCFQLRKMICYMEDGHPPCKDMILAGGGSKDPTWLQVKADILGMRLCIPDVEEASALGAALLAGVGCGLYHSYQEAGRVTHNAEVRVIQPETARTDYFKELYHEIYLPLEQCMDTFDKKIMKIKESRGNRYECN